MNAQLKWSEGLRFGAETGSGAKIVFDADSGTELPSPMEGLMTSLAACTAMDVISILEKKRQNVTSYSVEVSAERPPEGTYPRPFTKIVMTHILEGPDLDEAAVARAIELSETKYCSVAMTLRGSPEVVNRWRVPSRGG